MPPIAIQLTIEQCRELGRHGFCVLGVDEYRESDGTTTFCIECESCGIVLCRTSLGKPLED